MSGPEVMMAAGLSCLFLAAVIAFIREVTGHRRCQWVETEYIAPTFDKHGSLIEECACGARRASWRALGGDWHVHILKRPSPIGTNPTREEVKQ